MVAPGAPQRGERVLAILLKVNRDAVREGLERLVRSSRIGGREREPACPLEFRRTAGLEVLGSMLLRSNDAIDTAVVRAVIELRSVLAPATASFAAARRRRRHVVALREIVTEMRDAEADTAALARLALRFWTEVVSAADNLAFALAFNSLAISYGGVLDHLRHVLADELCAVDDYDSLADAITAKRGYAAGERARQIVSRGETALERMAKVLDAVQSNPGLT